MRATLQAIQPVLMVRDVVASIRFLELRPSRGRQPGAREKASR
jgi:hypothetical protein